MSADILPENVACQPPPRPSLPLPTELEEKILCELSLNARVVASCVCRKWADILVATPKFKKRRYTYTTPLTDSNVTVHRLVAASTGHMQCTLQNGGVTKYTFFYWRPDKAKPLKVDITNSPFLDDSVFLSPPVEETSGAVISGELRFRIGGVICDPILRGFFWHGDEEASEGVELTVRQMTERIAKRLVSEIESSRLLADRGLTDEGVKLKFRPTGRWTEKAGNGMDAVRDNMSVVETSTRFGGGNAQQGFVKQNPYQQNFKFANNSERWGV
ncbi:hypothetical protein TWF102_000899 [Orbilia oligospora]|uniref:F-box domain-containing protein n=1 Tax=Orbilia oligospora TaxID=2813651 RepID=A0A7C8JDF6_ORBOL|nr:hypothetical protein TWF706_000717 [Orbilia oligospora]KAF3107059.1 hypothetical protein TWF102_000899 [Orbilia oligospora]KAF3119061.1 hypothetical protein TWF703_003793 [Orbilia oligospora]KAF3130146.1 hypothetical protein TWF594_010541 [Orbilia oligospora]